MQVNRRLSMVGEGRAHLVPRLAPVLEDREPRTAVLNLPNAATL